MKKLILLFSLVLSINIMAQTPCVVIEWNADSTEYSIVNFNYNAYILPVIGLEPNLEVLIKRQPYAVPEYDSRLVTLSIINSISEDYDDEYTNNRMWLETYALMDRTITEKIVSVSESENYANFQVFPTTKHLKYIALALAILDKKASGLTISTKEQIILDRVNAKALLIWQNHVNAGNMVDTLNAGGSVDLDSDWNTTDPED